LFTISKAPEYIRGFCLKDLAGINFENNREGGKYRVSMILSYHADSYRDPDFPAKLTTTDNFKF